MGCRAPRARGRDGEGVNHQWDPVKDRCLKCGLPSFAWEDMGRPECGKLESKVRFLIDDRDLRNLEADLRKRGLI